MSPPQGFLLWPLLFTMLFAGSIVLSLALSALCARHPLSRATADVITSCVEPNTVALTFVCAAFCGLNILWTIWKFSTGRWSIWIFVRSLSSVLWDYIWIFPEERKSSICSKVLGQKELSSSVRFASDNSNSIEPPSDHHPFITDGANCKIKSDSDVTLHTTLNLPATVSPRSLHLWSRIGGPGEIRLWPWIPGRFAHLVTSASHYTFGRSKSVQFWFLSSGVSIFCSDRFILFLVNNEMRLVEGQSLGHSCYF